MRFLNSYLLSTKRNKVYTIGLLHCILVGIGVWSLIDEMIKYEELITFNEGVYVGLHYALHFIMILCLFIGTYMDIPYFLLPWLCTTLITFSILTALTVKNLKDLHLKTYNVSICLLNLICVCSCWCCWYTVYSYFKDTFKKGKIAYDKILS